MYELSQIDRYSYSRYSSFYHSKGIVRIIIDFLLESFAVTLSARIYTALMLTTDVVITN